MKYVFILLALIISYTGFSQNFLTNKKPIDKERYAKIKSSPYYFKDKVKAFMTMKKDEKPFEVSMNINLFENVIEVYQGDKYANIDYASMEKIMLEDSTSIIYVNRQLIVLPYIGEKYKLSNIPKVNIETKTLRPPGQIIEQQRFVKRDNYTLSVDDEPNEIDLNKKSLQKVLGKDAINLAKKNKIKFKSAQDVAKLLALLEEG